MDLEPFKKLIKGASGLCFEEEKAANLRDGILARKSERGMAADAEYLACLRRDDDELHRLINLLTINETYFFREPIHLDLLTDKLFQEMLASRTPGEPVRILSSGCSTGEEPYSVMIKLLEKYGAGIMSLIAITGADIDTTALARAEQGLYRGLAFRAFPASLREKYFDPEANDYYRIKDFVKEKVSFEELNLMSQAYPEGLFGMDAIFYRNVSIYFEPLTQRRIFEKLAGLLKENGWLFVSSTETLAHNHGSLSLVERDGVFCYQKNSEIALGDRRRQSPSESGTRAALTPAKPPAIAITPLAAPLRSFTSAPRPPAHHTPPPAHNNRSARASFDEALALAKSRRYAEALSHIDRILENEPNFSKGAMLKAGVLINLKRFGEAEALCQQSITQDRWSLEAHLLLGLIAKTGSDEELADKRFKEALYIQPSCWLAHYYLAESYGQRGDNKNACREYGVTIKLLQKGDLADHGLTFFPLAFPTEQIMHLCQHNLAKLAPGKQ